MRIFDVAGHDADSFGLRGRSHPDYADTFIRRLRRLRRFSALFLSRATPPICSQPPVPHSRAASHFGGPHGPPARRAPAA